MASEAPGRSIELALTGDVMLGRLVDDLLPEMTPEEPWGDLLPAMTGADWRMVNLECALTARAERWPGPKAFYFRARPGAVRVLQAARVDCCCLANNHALDFGRAGLVDTLETLERAGIRAVGAGRDLEAARRPALFERRGVRLGVVAFTDNEPAFAAGPRRPGTFYASVDDPGTLPLLAGLIAGSRREGAELVIVSAHWGPNMIERPSPEFRRFARALIAAGADLFHGHSAHLVQGVELREGRPILYDSGDFIDDYAVDPELRNDWSFLFLLRYQAGRCARLRLEPAILSTARVRRASAGEREPLLDRMRGLSAELGTALSPADGALEWRPGRRQARISENTSRSSE